MPAFARSLGQRALVVTDERLAADPTFAALIDAIGRAGVATKVFSGTIAELPASCITAGVETGRGFDPDLIIGIGGGSCIDAAKVIALILAHGGTASDYYGEFKIPGPVLPLIAVPTTSGTGSEVTPVAVIADPDRAVKVGIASPHLIPHTAICDPELTYSCPPSLTAISGADALTHAIEAFTTIRRDPTATIAHEHVFLGKNALSDHYARLAISHIAASLKPAYDNGADTVARERLMLGATAAGLAFGTAGTAAAHAIQYPVGALTHTPHGAGVAVMLPYVMEFNRSHARAAMAEIADAMGVETTGLSEDRKASAAIDAVAALFGSIGIPRTIAELGVGRDQLPLVAEQAMGAARLIKNNPRPLDPESMAALVAAAFHGDRSAAARLAS
ncbi:alcohol dehydrogenase [Bosea sp. BIWAKO-01]|nr:alcohol dehydrogenase [Bosea sp. BIWAKO-01]